MRFVFSSRLLTGPNHCKLALGHVLLDVQLSGGPTIDIEQPGYAPADHREDISLIGNLPAHRNVYTGPRTGFYADEMSKSETKNYREALASVPLCDVREAWNMIRLSLSFEDVQLPPHKPLCLLAKEGLEIEHPLRLFTL